MLGIKGHVKTGCCPYGSSLCTDDKQDVWTRCLSKTSMTFSTGTCHLLWTALCSSVVPLSHHQMHTAHLFPIPPSSVYPAGCCREAARRCYNCWRVNIYQRPMRLTLERKNGNDIMKSRGNWANICSHSGERLLRFLHGGGRTNWVTEEGSGLNLCPEEPNRGLVNAPTRCGEWLVALSA